MRQRPYLRSFRLLWDSGLALLVALVAVAGCANQHDKRAAEAEATAAELRQEASELRARATRSDDDLERELFLERANDYDARAERWDQRAAAEAELAHTTRTEESDRWLEIAGGVVALALGGYGLRRSSIKGAARVVNEERDARRQARGESV